MSKKRSNGEGTIYQRESDKKWYGEFCVGKDINGNDIWKYPSAKTEAELIKKHKKLLIKYSNNDYVAPDKKPLHEHLTIYLELKRKNKVKLGSYERLLETKNNIKKSKIGKKTANEITSEMIQEYINSLTDKYARNTIIKMYNLLKCIFTYLVTIKLIRDNPFVDISMPREEAKIIDFDIDFDNEECKWFNDSQKQILLKELHREYKSGRAVYKHGLVYEFMLYTGLRLGEALALTWKDVNFEKRVIRINKTIYRVSKISSEQRIIVQAPKTKSSNRIIPLNSRAIEILKRYKWQNKNINTNIAFCTSSGRHVDPKKFIETFTKICKKIGLGGYTTHCLRHTFATDLFLKKLDIKYISKLLGHADIRTTYNIYIHIIMYLMKNDENETINAMESLCLVTSAVV